MFIRAFFVAFIMSLPVVSYANCWQIKDNDRRNFCLAQDNDDSLYCWQISNNDKRNECLALVQQDSLPCWQIKDNDKRNECLALSE